MDALRVAAPLARLLLAWGEGERQGELIIAQRARAARLTVVGGRLVGLSGVDVRPLGDTLLALGALDLASQRRLLGRTDARQPVGAWLVAAGATSSEAVQQALALQLSHGIDVLLRWPVASVQREDCTGAETTSRSGASVDLTSAVWSSLLAIAARLPEATLSELAGSQALVLTPAGHRRARGLVVASESGALAASCARRAFGTSESMRAPAVISNESLQQVLANGPTLASLPLRAVLRALGAARLVSQAPPEDAYALLLRKTRELARNASANVLLDLPEVASSAHARKALRRLALKLHPDRFQASDARLQAVSTRVMGALSHAEHKLRSAGSA